MDTTRRQILQALRVFLPESGTPVTKTFTLEPTSRTTVYAGLISELADSSFGIDVTVASGSIAAERALYWTSGGVFWAAGTHATATRLP